MGFGWGCSNGGSVRCSKAIKHFLYIVRIYKKYVKKYFRYAFGVYLMNQSVKIMKNHTDRIEHLNLTMDYFKSVDGGYVGIVREIEGVISQGETFKELKFNIKDAVKAMLHAKKTISNKSNTLLGKRKHNTQEFAIC